MYVDFTLQPAAIGFKAFYPEPVAAQWTERWT